jgi:hypothetical protein
VKRIRATRRRKTTLVAVVVGSFLITPVAHAHTRPDPEPRPPAPFLLSVERLLDPPTHVGSLDIGDSLFWDGAYVEDSLGAPYQDWGCDSPLVKCFDYTIDVGEGGGHLRVAIDDNSSSDPFDLLLYDPLGQKVAEKTGIWSIEQWVPQPMTGTWTVRVHAAAVENASFRLRAKLEGPPTPLSPGHLKKELLPNLRLTPPLEFTFERPSNLALPTESGPMPNENGDPVLPQGCTATEIADAHVQERPAPVRCLRFTVGPQNVGEGPLRIEYQASVLPTEEVPVTQIIERADGSDPIRRRAGSAKFHTTHAHYHHVGFGTLELYRVTDGKKGSLVLVGAGPKQGFCLMHFQIVDWYSFDQAPVDEISTCEERGGGATDNFIQGAAMVLEKGWSDAYGWGLDGNYVDFGTNGDGLYVVRSITDPDDVIAETNETDNAGYALIQVSGSDVTLLERGYGMSPWDLQKVVAPGAGWLPGNADIRPVPYTDLR